MERQKYSAYKKAKRLMGKILFRPQEIVPRWINKKELIVLYRVGAGRVSLGKIRGQRAQSCSRFFVQYSPLKMCVSLLSSSGSFCFANHVGWYLNFRVRRSAERLLAGRALLTLCPLELFDFGLLVVRLVPVTGLHQALV